MQRFLYPIAIISATLITATFCTAQISPPAGISDGLFAWYEAPDFQENSQTWPAKFGGVPLTSLTLDNSKAKLITPYARRPYIEMKGVGFRAELLTNDANASYTVFAVALPTGTFPQGTYKEMTWGMGPFSAYPGFALKSYRDDPPNPRVLFNNSRFETIGEIAQGLYQITSLTFSYGTAQAGLSKIASMNGLSKTMDEGNALFKQNNWVHLNLNAAFAPHGGEQHHDFAEFIIYNRRLTENERHRVETYLSFKYGMPLVLGKPNGGVLTLDGTTMLWDSTRKFNHHVRALGKFGTILESTTTGRIYSEAIVLSVPENSSGFTNDNGWILIGENGGQYQYDYDHPTVPLAGGGVRLRKVWRVQNTGVNHKVTAGFPSPLIPGGGISIDPCAPQRLIISSDSTFQTYTAYTLTPSVFNTPTTFSSYVVDLTFPPGESFVTFANVDSYGTPHIPDNDTGLLSLKSCENEDGFLHFIDPLGHPTVAILGLPYETLTNSLTNASIRILEEPVTYSDGNKSAALMRRMLTLTSTLTAFPNPVTVRYYLPDSDLTDTDQLGGSNRTWYKRNGNAQQFLNDFLDDGSIDPNESIVVTPVFGTSVGVPYVEFQNLTSFSTIGMISTERSLPVRLADFRAMHEGTSTLLQWKTTAERDFSHFAVQRSTDAKTWEELGVIPGSNVGSNYSFHDASPLTGLNYYRLKMVDRDGSAEYSDVASLAHEATDWIIYPNPASTRISLSNVRINSGISLLSITDHFGIPRILLLKPTMETIDVSRLNPGIYQLKISFGDGSSQSKQLVVAP